MGVAHVAMRRPGNAAPFLERARAKDCQQRAMAFHLGLAYFAQARYAMRNRCWRRCFVFRRAADFRRDGLDDRPLRRVLALMLQDQPSRAFPYFR
jgi:hypothetical protein